MGIQSILILTAVRLEARAIARRLDLKPMARGTWQSNQQDKSIHLSVIGIGAPGLHEIRPDNVAYAVMAGLAGALDPSLGIGQVVIGEPAPDGCHGLPCHFGKIHTSATVIETAEAKAILHAQTGACAVEMENQIVAKWAAQNNLRVVYVRAISDTAQDAIDPAMLGLIDSTGHPRMGRLASELLRRPTLLPTLLRLGRHSMLAADHLAKAVELIISQTPV